MEAGFLSKSIDYFACCLLLILTCREVACQPTVDLRAEVESETGATAVQLEIDALRGLVEKLALESAEQRAQLTSLKHEKLREKGRESQQLTTQVDTSEDVRELRRLFKIQQEQLESFLQLNVSMGLRLVQLEVEKREQNEELLSLKQDIRSLRINLQTLNSSLQGQAAKQRLQLEEQSRQIGELLRTSIRQEERFLTVDQVNNSVQEVVAKQDELISTLTQMNRTVQTEIAGFKEKNRVHEELLKETNSSILNELSSQISSLRQEEASRTTTTSNTNVVTFTRWGRKVCPQNSTAVYTGYGAGNHYSKSGGGSNYLCLPVRPQWGTTIDGTQGIGSKIYGLEYELTQTNSPFLKTNNGGQQLNDMDAPCVICQVREKSASIMIPAMRECPAGWQIQYRGYLVSSHETHSKTEYVCLDEAPEANSGSHRNENGALFYPVEAACGSLPCPHYHAGWEIACVVCVK